LPRVPSIYALPGVAGLSVRRILFIRSGIEWPFEGRRHHYAETAVRRWIAAISLKAAAYCDAGCSSHAYGATANAGRRGLAALPPSLRRALVPSKERFPEPRAGPRLSRCHTCRLAHALALEHPRRSARPPRLSVSVAVPPSVTTSHVPRARRVPVRRSAANLVSAFVRSFRSARPTEKKKKKTNQKTTKRLIGCARNLVTRRRRTCARLPARGHRRRCLPRRPCVMRQETHTPGFFGVERHAKSRWCSPHCSSPRWSVARRVAARSGPQDRG